MINLVQCDFWMVVVATLEHYDFFSRGRPPTSGNLSTPAELWVSSSHFCRGHLYLWGKHIEIVSPILLQLLKTVNGGRLFSFLNVKLVLYNSQSLHWFTFQKWGFSWSWRLTNIENETIKFEDEWSLIQRHNWQSNIFNEAIVLMVLLLSLSGETCHFLDFFPTLTKVFLFMTTLSMCFLH